MSTDEEPIMVQLDDALEAYALGELSEAEVATLHERAKTDPYLAELLVTLEPRPAAALDAVAKAAEQAMGPAPEPWWRSLLRPMVWAPLLVPALAAALVLLPPQTSPGWEVVEIQAGDAARRSPGAALGAVGPGSRVVLTLDGAPQRLAVSLRTGSGGHVLQPTLERVDDRTRVEVWLPESLEARDVTLVVEGDGRIWEQALDWRP
jgi:hypothetical protein